MVLKIFTTKFEVKFNNLHVHINSVIMKNKKKYQYKILANNLIVILKLIFVTNSPEQFYRIN